MATEIRVPFEAFAEFISQLPSDALVALRDQTEEQLLSRGQQTHGDADVLEGEEFWKSELGKMVLDEADDSLSHEDLRRSLSSIKGSLSDDVAAERDER